MNEELEREMLAFYQRLNARDDPKGAVQALRRQVMDLSAFPTDLASDFYLSPAIYDGVTRRFDMIRTPNVFPTGRIAAAGAGATPISSASAFGGAAAGSTSSDLVPKDQRKWKLLGGIISVSAAASIAIRALQGARTFYGATFAAAAAGVPFVVPANGGEINADAKGSFELWVSAAVTVDFVLYVAEEGDTTGRGGV